MSKIKIKTRMLVINVSIPNLTVARPCTFSTVANCSSTNEDLPVVNVHVVYYTTWDSVTGEFDASRSPGAAVPKRTNHSVRGYS